MISSYSSVTISQGVLSSGDEGLDDNGDSCDPKDILSSSEGPVLVRGLVPNEAKDSATNTRYTSLGSPSVRFFMRYMVFAGFRASFPVSVSGLVL